jgi:NAD(P)-dependent dehydrogenase (short-subunit alcohol dehydrogenase family)
VDSDWIIAYRLQAQRPIKNSAGTRHRALPLLNPELEQNMDTSTLFSLEDRIALVTGGSRNLGRTIAEAYIAQGATVYISSRKAADCEATARELGPKCHSLPQDVSTVAGAKALAQAFAESEQRLDILVNNAGAAWGEPFADFPERGWDKVMDLNLKSPFFLIQALYQPLKAAGASGHPAKVINITSVDGQRLNPWETYSYHASKAGLIYLTKRLAARLVQDNIVVTSIAPGAFASDMNKAARDSADEVGKKIPLGRIGSPEDLAGAAIFLASRAGDYVVGDTITVDGGLVHAALGPSIDA